MVTMSCERNEQPVRSGTSIAYGERWRCHGCGVAIVTGFSVPRELEPGETPEDPIDLVPPCGCCGDVASTCACMIITEFSPADVDGRWDESSRCIPHGRAVTLPLMARLAV
jgi:hypothetical protein